MLKIKKDVCYDLVNQPNDYGLNIVKELSFYLRSNGLLFFYCDQECFKTEEEFVLFIPTVNYLIEKKYITCKEKTDNSIKLLINPDILESDFDLLGDSPCALTKNDDPVVLFDKFWLLYPKKRRIAKKQALASFKRLKLTEIEFNDLIAKLPIQIELMGWNNSDPSFIPHPSTYLNNRRWEDEIEAIKPFSLRDAVAERLSEPDNSFLGFESP